VALGLVAPILGGTNRLISAPCAPAAAVLSAFAIQLLQQGVSPQEALLFLALTGLACGLLQILFGSVRLGQLIKYMPYPVVSGYLSGVGIVIIFSQISLLLGTPKDVALWDVLTVPSLWGWESIVVGLVTIGVMLGAGRVTKAVPAAILGLVAGVAAYFAIAVLQPALLEVDGNPLIVGPLGGAGNGFVESFTGRWSGLESFDAEDLTKFLLPAITLAVLLSIDTLKTCVVLDALTRTRHNSNRELIGQGFGNLASTLVGGMPGAGQMGGTLVNMASGGRTRLSGVIEGALALIAFLLLADLVAFVPVASLAGILIVIGGRMIDWKSLHFLRSRSTILDFAVIVAVIVTAKTISLIAASGVGIALALMLFIREQINSSVVHHKSFGNQLFSKQVRLPEEMEILRTEGECAAILELQGSLFFGTADQLYRAIEPELKERTYVMLDLRRVQAVDVTAAHILEQIEDTLHERRGFLIFSHLPRLPSGREMEDYFEQVDLVKPGHQNLVFGELDEALEWVENRILERAGAMRAEENFLDLDEIGIFRNRQADTMIDLESCMETRTIKAKDQLFAFGDQSDELYLIRRGAIRIVQPLTRGQGHHLATYNRGDFFGEMSFLDREPRSADAYAAKDTDLFVLSRADFDDFVSRHPRGASNLLEGLARTLSHRLRFTNAELLQYEDS